MRIHIHFFDGEVVEADSDSLHQERLSFFAKPTEGNNRLAWVPLSAVKYIKFPGAPNTRPAREGSAQLERLDKIILRFRNGEVIRAFKDDAFSTEGYCVNVQMWSREEQRLERAMVPAASLKAVFFVETWDSRVGRGDAVAHSGLAGGSAGPVAPPAGP